MDLISLAIHVTAVAAAVWYLRRTKDWRFLILAAIAVMMAIRHALIMSAEGPFDPAVFMAAAEDLPGFAESLLILIAIVAFGRLFGAQVKERVRLRDILSSASDLDWQVDARGRFEYISNRLAQITDEEVTALIGSRAIPVDPASGALPGGWAGLLETVMRREPFSEVITEVTRPNGEVLFLSHSGTPITSPTGEYVGYRGSSRNVTNQVRAEQALRLMQRAVDESLAAIALSDTNGKLTYVNKSFLNLFGFPNKEEALAAQGPDFWENPEGAATVAQLLKEGKSFVGEMVGKRRDGSRIHLRQSANVIRDEATGAAVAWMASMQDDTPLKRSELDLQLRSAALDAAQEGVFIADARQGDQPIIYANAEFEKMNGYASAEVIGQNCWFLLGSEGDQPGQSEIRQALAQGNPVTTLLRNYRKDGTLFWHELHISPVRNTEGAVTYFIGIQRDVTERQRVAERFRASEEKNRAIIDSAPIAIVGTSLEGLVDVFNSAAEQIFGYRADEMLGKDVAILYEEPLRSALGSRLKAYLERGETGLLGKGLFPAIGRRADGTTFPLEISFTDYADGSGRHFIGAVIDITARRKAEASLMIAQAALASSADGMALMDIDGTISWANRSFLEMYGFDHLEDMVGTRADLLWADSVAVVEAVKQMETSGSWAGEALGKRRDGTTFWAQITGSVVFDEKTGEPVAWMTSNQDITERRRAAEALGQSEARLANAQRVAHVGNWDLTLRDNRLVWSDEVYRINGLRREDVDLTVELAQSMTHPADRERVDSETAKYLSDPDAPPYQLERRIIRPDGQVRVVRTLGEATRDDAGKAVRLSGVIQDITEQKQAQTALERSESKNRLVMESVAIGLVTIDDAGLIESFNPEATRIFGYSEEEMVGTNVAVLMPQPYQSAHDGYLNRYLLTHESHLLGQGPREFVGRCKDGNVFPIDLAVSQMTLDGRTTFIGSIQDVSARKATEDRLRQSQKMETVGQLTGGVAHDFNNILMAMQLNLEMVEDRVAADEDARDSMRAALAAVQRGAELTGRLLAFSRQQPLQPKVVNVNVLVGETMRLLHRALEESIDVETVLAAGVWSVEVDPGQFANALINLAVNGRDAMPTGGKLTIETTNTRLDEDYARQYDDVRPGQYVMIAVSDAGTGMPPEVIERAFDPFFTTKDVGKGTGLGLSMVYGFVKQSGGHVKIYSELRHGTTIKMYFPRTLVSGEKEERKAVATAARSRGETILLVEDDPDVRLTVHRILTALGYLVHAASNGPEALALVDGGLRPDLLLADVMLPLGMTGADVSRAVAERVQECRTLFMSGYTDNAIIHQGRLDAGVVLLSKPFPREALAAKLRETLHTAQA